MAQSILGMVPFRSGDKYLHVLLLNQDDNWVFPHDIVSGDRLHSSTYQEEVVQQFQSLTGLNPLVISSEPVFDHYHDGNEVRYFAGFISPDQELMLESRYSKGYWFHERSVRRKLQKTPLLEIFDDALEWYINDDYSAEFLANNLAKLQ